MSELAKSKELLIGASLAALGIYYLLRPKKMPLNVGGPKGHSFPVNSVALEFVNNFDHVHELLERLSKENGDVFHVNLFGTSTIVVSDTDLIRKIILNRETFQLPPSMRKSLPYCMGGKGSMFASEGEVWKAKHRILEPMHKINFLRFHALTVSQSMRKSVELLDYVAGERAELPLDIFPILCRATITVIGQAVFGVDFGVLASDSKDLEEIPILAHTFSVILGAISNRLNLPEFIWPLQYYLTEERAAGLKLKGFFQGLLDAKIKERAELKNAKESAPQGSVTSTTILDLILQFKEDNPEAQDLYANEEIFDECLSFFGAGFETTALTACFLLFHLATYPAVQEKVYEEVKRVAEDLGDDENDDGTKIYDAFQQMNYLSWVIKESQRLLAVVPSLPRYAVKDAEISGINFPQGTQVLLNLNPIYHSDKYFPNPEEFIPERWDNSDGDKTEKPAYTFGYGTRACFGQKLAILQLKAFIFHLLQKFKVIPDPKHPLETEFCFTVRPKNDKAHFILVPR